MNAYFLLTDEDDVEDSTRRLRLKGQMMFMQEWDAVIFLGTPVLVLNYLTYTIIQDECALQIL